MQVVECLQKELALRAGLGYQAESVNGPQPQRHHGNGIIHTAGRLFVKVK
jgi:hypothetical protein